MKNILVPCDFSEPSEEAFKFAVRIAGQSEGEVHVIHIIDITSLNADSTISNSYVFNADFLKNIEKNAKQKFQTMWEKYAPLTMRIKFRHLLGSVALEIENYINANNIDLVLMGTHAEGNAPSNTQKIVRVSKVPLIAIRTAPRDIKNIALAVSADHFNDDIIQQVKQLQNFFQATLHLVYINTPLVFQSDADSNSLLTEFAARAEFTNYTVSVRSDYSVEAGLIHFVKEINADMIAMGTHGWRGLTRLFIGSTAENIVSELKVPVWSHYLTTGR